MIALFNALPLILFSSTPARVEIPAIQPTVHARSNRHDRSRAAIPANAEADWVTTSDYPRSAWTEGRAGITAVNLHIGVDGVVSRCEITSSSGSEDLDIAACNAPQVRARFTPALDARGRPVTSVYTKRVRWQLPGLNEDAPPLVPGFRSVSGIIVRTHFSQNRELLECTVEFVGVSPQDGQEAAICSAIGTQLSVGLPSDLPSEGAWVHVRNLAYAYTTAPE